MDYVTLKDILLFVGLCISNICTWLFSRRKQNNDFLAELRFCEGFWQEQYSFYRNQATCLLLQILL